MITVEVFFKSKCAGYQSMVLLKYSWALSVLEGIIAHFKIKSLHLSNLTIKLI